MEYISINDTNIRASRIGFWRNAHYGPAFDEIDRIIAAEVRDPVGLEFMAPPEELSPC